MFEVEKIAIVGTSCFLVPLAGSNVKRYPYRASNSLLQYAAKECRFPTILEYEKCYLNSYSV